MPSPLGCSFGGRMRLWRKKKRQRKRQKLVPSPRAPSAVDAFGGTRTESCVGGNRRDQDWMYKCGCLRKGGAWIRACESDRYASALAYHSSGLLLAQVSNDESSWSPKEETHSSISNFTLAQVCDAQQENLRRACGEFVESAQQESFAAKFAESYREFNGQVDSAADGTTAHAAGRIAGISRWAARGETRLFFVGMELGVLGDGSRVAAWEEPASARLSTASGEMASERLGVGLGMMRGRRRRPPVRVQECACFEGRRNFLRRTFQELQVEQERI